MFLIYQSFQRDSNPRPADYKSAALSQLSYGSIDYLYSSFFKGFNTNIRNIIDIKKLYGTKKPTAIKLWAC